MPEVFIHRLGGMGDGIGELGGKPVFVPKTLAGDTADIEIIEACKDFARGRLLALVAPSPNRIAAPCPHFDHCGGCALQHVPPEDYRRFKQGIIQNALKAAGTDSALARDLISVPTASRRRVEFRVEGGQLAYHGERSHQRVSILQCLILTPALQDLVGNLNYTIPEPIALLRLADSDSGIDLSATLRAMPDAAARRTLCVWGKETGVRRFTIFHGDQTERMIDGPIQQFFGEYSVDLPPGAFLQASREGETAIAREILTAIPEGARVLDLFSGIGGTALRLSASCPVTSAEFDAAMVETLKRAAARHHLTQLRAVQRDLFKQPFRAEELNRFTAAIINPPRAGADAQCKELARSRLPLIVMVSCHPGSFARDTKTLLAGGYRLEYAQGIDQFVYSTHVEIVAVFRR